MNWRDVETSDDYGPLFWVGEKPIHATTFFLMVHGLALVVCQFLYAFNPLFISQLTLNTDQVWRGEVWRIGTQAFVEPPLSPSLALFFLWGMFLLYFCGREVEKMMGRRVFIGFYVCALFLPSVLLAASGWFWSLSYPNPVGGSFVPIFAVLIACAILYPDIDIGWFQIPLKWMATILIGLNSLCFMVYRAHGAQLALWLTIALTFLAMNLLGFGRASWWTEWWHNRQLTRAARRQNLRVVREEELQLDTDAILEKISRHGLQSLSPRERRTLEETRTSLLEKEQKK
jgi:membrane associated rhomboid family serine protease